MKLEVLSGGAAVRHTFGAVGAVGDRLLGGAPAHAPREIAPASSLCARRLAPA
jgi:hypothetical protein